ncbi:hypothetical protein GUJ93_ZPchr0007g4594 [Zizania palustris]|uniref:Uncharacterized protein n=1 Tax=Zizania palustris TaxID=103762 RepID=A0A8J5VTI2_ZIZPA|nr:hypothetical protein GUJ93_ZPchr0007g4594 [Zizania palustris]
MTTIVSSSCSTGKETLATPQSDLGRSALTDRRRALEAMEGMWRKAKKALGVGLCVHIPAVSGDREDNGSERWWRPAVSGGPSPGLNPPK